MEANAFPPFDGFLQTIADLVYCGEAGSIPIVVPARLSTLHRSGEITFQVVCPAWKAHLGWGPGACVEIQVCHISGGRRPDSFFWMDRTALSRP